ncbi:MAG: FAD-dependent oxidoreductase, partial [Spirochaetales bacterium]|nr:FAD-dependent oxidoreductase [Spirochaetales bacterium]
DTLGVEIKLSTKVVGIFENKIVSLITDDDKVSTVRAGKIVLATGGIEKPLAFPGWTLPGVITAGAAQTICNIERVLPGKKIVMIGSGNVGLIVSYQLLQAGAEVKAVIEAGNRIGGYAVHAAKIKRAGIPIIMGHTIISARGKDQVEEIEIAALDKDWNHIPGSEKTIEADTVCLSVGLNPNTRAARLAECRMEYFPELGGFMPVHDINMESSINGIFIAGDLAGIEEANTALDEGRIAGISAAASLGYIEEMNFLELRKTVWSRLDSLRDGSLGAKRLAVKSKITGRNGEHGVSSGKSINTSNHIGTYSLKEFQKSPGFPSGDRIRKGAVACIECAQEIPCNPCVDSCPSGAIT